MNGLAGRMRRDLLPLLGSGLLAATALLAAAWVFSVDTEPDLVVSEPIASRDPVVLPAPAPLVAAARPERRRPARAPRVRKERPPLEQLLEEKDPMELRDWELPPDERATARNQFRDERLTELSGRLDAHAEAFGWDPATTEEVRAVLLETSGRISDTLAQVDAGEVHWLKVRDDLRDFRLQQARDVEEILGPDAFDDWAGDMGFERFPEEGKPVHGRLDDPPRRAPKRPRGRGKAPQR